MGEAEYKNLVRYNFWTKHYQHKDGCTVHEKLEDIATEIADWLTNKNFSRVSEEVDKKVNAYANSLASEIHWGIPPNPNNQSIHR